MRVHFDADQGGATFRQLDEPIPAPHARHRSRPPSSPETRSLRAGNHMAHHLKNGSRICASYADNRWFCIVIRAKASMRSDIALMGEQPSCSISKRLGTTLSGCSGNLSGRNRDMGFTVLQPNRRSPVETAPVTSGFFFLEMTYTYAVVIQLDQFHQRRDQPLARHRLPAPLDRRSANWLT